MISSKKLKNDASLAHLTAPQKKLLARAAATRKYGFVSAAALMITPLFVVMLVRSFAPHTIIDAPYANHSPITDAVLGVSLYCTPVALAISAIGHIIVRHLMNRDDPNAWGPLGTALRSFVFLLLVLFGSVISVTLYVIYALSV